jgi:outer membrane protein assembly factor BamA
VYLNAGVTLTTNIGDHWSLDARVRGAKVAYQDTELAPDAVVADVTDDPAVTPDNIPDPGVPGYDVSGELTVEYDNRANWYGVSHGNRYRLRLSYAPEWDYSDFAYWYGSFDLQWARRFFARHNLVFKATAGYGRDVPFQHEFTSGGTDLRGFKNDQYRGDVQAAASVEYSVPVVAIKGVALRALAFADTAYTALYNADPATDTVRNYLPGQGALGLAPWKNTVGVGIRLNVRQIVLPLLGVDFGYGIERKSTEIYLAIGLTDV